MLRSFETLAELYEAQDLTHGSPYLLPIHYSIRHEVQNVFPESKCSIYGFPAHAPHLWLMVRRNKFTRPHVFMGSRSQLLVDEAEIDAFMLQVIPVLRELDEFNTRILGIHLSNRMCDVLSSYFDFSSPSYLSNYYLINELKQREIGNLDIQVPNGYEFVDLNHEYDAERVASTWKFSSEGDRHQFAAKILRLPSAAIRSYSGDLASFVVLDPAGYFNNQFTFPEHRQRGLADRSELKLCQKVINEGLYPMKFVEVDNAAVNMRSMKSAWWSAVVDEAGVSVLNDHRVVYRLDSI